VSIPHGLYTTINSKGNLLFTSTALAMVIVNDIAPDGLDGLPVGFLMPGEAIPTHPQHAMDTGHRGIVVVFALAYLTPIDPVLILNGGEVIMPNDVEGDTFPVDSVQ
jgi:hypothetical protein